MAPKAKPEQEAECAWESCGAAIAAECRANLSLRKEKKGEGRREGRKEGGREDHMEGWAPPLAASGQKPNMLLSVFINV